MANLIQDWMTTEVITTTSDETIIQADEILREYGIRRLPVVNDRGKVVGIITKGDVREAKPSDASSLSIWEINYLVAKLKVRDVMTNNVLTVLPTDEIEEAADVMLNNKVSGLPVVTEGGELVGTNMSLMVLRYPDGDVAAI
ncbi:MAG: CBS domain-containing protein [Chloroflexota bacterium]